MGIFIIGYSIVIIVVYLGMSLTFQYLITTKRIKGSKVSKIFYDDNESFLKSWEKIQAKGIFIHIIKTVIFTTVGMGIIRMIFLSTNHSSYGYEEGLTLWDNLLFGFNFGLLFSVFNWFVSKDRYRKLKEKS